MCLHVQVGTPVTAAIRYREAAQLARLGLSPYAGAAFHGPPLLLTGAQLADSLLGRVIPGFSVLAAPWRVLATSAADVAAAAALARLAAAVAAPRDGKPGTGEQPGVLSDYVHRSNGCRGCSRAREASGGGGDVAQAAVLAQMSISRLFVVDSEPEAASKEPFLQLI